MNRQLVLAVWRRAGDRCEYCRIPKFALPLPFQIDHIIAEKHGGETVEENLALACPHCNRFKGPNIAGVDPDTGETVRLFRKRQRKPSCALLPGPAEMAAWHVSEVGKKSSSYWKSIERAA